MVTGQLRELLGDTLYNVFYNAHVLMCIYNTRTNTISNINPEMTSHTGDDFNGDIEVIVSTPSEIYITLDNIPCKLILLSEISTDFSIMLMSPAHTKKWTQTSDLVSLTDVTSDGVWEWFPELNFEYMSKRFWAILGYEQSDMDETPMSWMGFLNPDDKEGAMKLCYDHIKSNGVVPYVTKVRYTHKEGHEVIVLCRGSVVDWMPGGKPWRLLGTHTDITDIVKKDAIDAKTKFISRMSHEIRSPVCTILNECELLGDTMNTSVIRDTCKQLLSVTNDILNINNVKKSELVLQKTNGNISDIISRCVKRHRVSAKKKGMKIRMVLDDLPQCVMVDISKFNQVLDNLIGNALKYSPDSSGVITLDVEYDSETSTCYVRVSDHGIGMKPSFHTVAFEELVQGDNTMIGVGIGLTLCRLIAKKMGGDTTIEESELGKGTTILFESKLVECFQEVEKLEDKMDFKVMIVDDIYTNRVILKRRLESMDKMGLCVTSVTEAIDGQDAVDKFIDHGGNFQLILMDCHMPILNGFDATVKIHDTCASMDIPPVPVVAVTASVSSDIGDRCRDSGMKYVVTKPYSEIDLMTSIQACMRKSFNEGEKTQPLL